MRPLAGVSLAVVLCVSAALLHAQSQVVRATVPKANVRSEPNDKAPVFQQVTPKDPVEWRATEGDWFKILLPPNPALGGARVEAYISKKVSKLEAAPAMPSALAGNPAEVSAEKSGPPAIDTHAANVFLGSIADGLLLKVVSVQIVHTPANRDAWTIQNPGDWSAASDRRPALVISIGDRAPFASAGLAPALVKLAPAQTGMMGAVIGSAKSGKDWKSDDMPVDVTEGTVGVWNLKPSKDLKPGDYAILMRPLNSKSIGPEVAWAFTVK
jgi:hypothetical protein